MGRGLNGTEKGERQGGIHPSLIIQLMVTEHSAEQVLLARSPPFPTGSFPRQW